MKKIWGAGLFFLFILFSLNTSASGQGWQEILIEGKVTTACFNYPCAGAEVSVQLFPFFPLVPLFPGTKKQRQILQDIMSLSQNTLMGRVE